MNVRFNRVLAYIFILVGLLTGIVQLIFLTNYIQLFSSLILLIVGIRYLTSVYFHINDTSIEIKTLLGKIYKRYEFNSLEEVIVKGNTLFLIQNEKHIKIKTSKFMSNSSDWNKAINLIKRSDISNELHQL